MYYLVYLNGFVMEIKADTPLDTSATPQQAQNINKNKKRVQFLAKFIICHYALHLSFTTFYINTKQILIAEYNFL